MGDRNSFEGRVIEISTLGQYGHCYHLRIRPRHGDTINVSMDPPKERPTLGACVSLSIRRATWQAGTCQAHDYWLGEELEIVSESVCLDIPAAS